LETISPKILEKVSSDPAFHKKWGLLLNFRFATAPFLLLHFPPAGAASPFALLALRLSSQGLSG